MNIKRKIRSEQICSGFERISTESRTIPNDTLSIQQILVNFTRGTLPPVAKIPNYHEEDIDSDSYLDSEIPDLSIKDDIKNILDSEANRNKMEPRQDQKEADQQPVEPPQVENPTEDK